MEAKVAMTALESQHRHPLMRLTKRLSSQMQQETPTKMCAEFVVCFEYVQDDFQRGGVTLLPRYELATVHSWERRCKQWSKDGVGLRNRQHFGKD